MGRPSRNLLLVGLGVALMLGMAPVAWGQDSDGDGVIDPCDQCPDTDPNTPFGATDSVGCSMVLTYSHFKHGVASDNYSIATDSNGDVFVASSDSGDPDPIPINKYERLTFANLATFDANAPKSPGAARVSPYGLDVDSQGNIVVVMTGGSTYTLSTLSATGVPIRQLDLSVEPNCHVSDIAVDRDDNVWVVGRQVELVEGVPTYVDHVELLDKDNGSVIMGVDNDDLAPAGLSWDQAHDSVAVDENGLVYVSDHYRIIRFDPCDVGSTAVVIAGNADNSAGTGPGEFTGPIKGIAVVGDRLYAGDAPFHDPNTRVQIFRASTGAFIQELSHPTLVWIHGLDVDAQGNIYVNQPGSQDSFGVHLFAPPFCGDAKHPTPGADVNEDCYVNDSDLVDMAELWLECTDPQGVGCQDLIQAEVMYMPHCGDINVDGLLGDWTDPCWVDLDLTYAGEPCDIVSAKYTVCWDPCDDKLYAAIVVDDSVHTFVTGPTGWDDSDKMEIYVQADPNGGDQWGSEKSTYFDKAQQYAVGYGGFGTYTWAVFGNGSFVPGNADPGNADFDKGAKVSGSVVTYEIGAKAFVWYGGRTIPVGSLDSVVRELEPGMRVGFDVVADSRWGDEDLEFGMVSNNLDTQKYIYAENFQKWALLDYDGSVAPPGCGDWGYLDADVNPTPDCYVDMDDFLEVAVQWLDCTDPDTPCNYAP